ncbi:hypothetical protein BDN71DRAFT_1508658 [Pleurotus eryngii]|uniref:Uncharacterized protein n=1 Tax=Pleurotus eryngii TaxID=5323 RepID=A0A9P5ZV65_PLEER|nr:hypothetical protein BDN71DRAFT_1508658 [Pleurotus eryngii]
MPSYSTYPFHEDPARTFLGHFDALTRSEAQPPYIIAAPHEYGALFSALSKCCPSLESITLFAAEPPETVPEHAGVSFHHAMPFQLTTVDIVTIARALPKLTTLVLNPAPHIAIASTLAISVLSIFRDLCPNPNLVSLGLYVDAADEHILSPPVNDDENHRVVLTSAEFTSMMSFTIGWSSLSSPIPLALYSSSVLPDNCLLDASLNKQHREAVQRLMPAFKQVRAQGMPAGHLYSCRDHPR